MHTMPTLSAQVLPHLLHDMVRHGKAFRGAAGHTGARVEHRGEQRMGVGDKLDYARIGS
jgi:hypothetical protein